MEKKISDFLDDEYKKFSYHVIENRALASICDGLKPTQRKVIFVSEKHIKNTFNTVETLAGRIVSDAKYHHGSSSAEGAIVNMCQEFKNNMVFFQKDGQFGSLKAPFASAPRYIKVKLDNIYNLVFKDDQLLEHKIEEGYQVEPKFYLPIIPLILINGNSGIAIGFASNILNRDPQSIIKDCLSYLKTGKIGELKPSINTFIGTFINDTENSKKWYIKGIFSIINSTTVKVSELPPSVGYEKFEEHLDILLEQKKITNWENHGKNCIDYIIKFNRDTLSELSIDNIDKLLKLTDQVTENFTVLDEHGKLKIFNSAEEIIKYFIDFRLSYYVKRKIFLLDKISTDLKILSNKGKFIKMINKGEIEIKSKKKEELIESLTINKFDLIKDSYDYLLNMSITSLTTELYIKLGTDFKTLKEEVEILKNKEPKDMYIEDLMELKSKIKK